MYSEFDVSARRIPYNGSFFGISKRRSKQRVDRRKDQVIVYIDENHLDYTKDSFGSFTLNKHLWNEGGDFLRKVDAQ